MKETTKSIKKLNIIVKYEFNSNKFMESSEQSARDKFKHYMSECRKCAICCETKRAKEILEETINIVVNRYDDYIKFHYDDYINFHYGESEE